MVDSDAERGVEPAARRIPILVVAAIYALTTIAVVVASGASNSGFGAHDDEAAHLTSSLMVRDYLAAGMPGSPLEYAKNYYLHYPKVGLGHWPPVLPGVVGIWMLIAGASVGSLLLLFGAMTVATALVIYLAARRDAGELLAAAAGLLFLLLPLVQGSARNVMTEMPLALACTLAVVFFGRFLESGRLRHSVWFAILATLAILTKGSALALAFVPPIAIALTGRWDLLRRPALWSAMVIVGVCCAPWYVATLSISTSSWVGGSSPTVGHALPALGFYPRELLACGGFGVGLAGLAGLFFAVRSKLRRGRWAAYVAWIPSAMISFIMVPTGLQARHLVVVVPIWLVMAALGTRWAVSRWPRFSIRKVHLAPLLVGACFLPIASIERKDVHGYDEAALAILADANLAGSVLLIESDAIGEGSFITAVAINERRPGHIVLRASKVLGASDWMGGQYKPTFATVDELSAFLQKVPVEVLAIDDSAGRRHRYPHLDMLLEIVANNPDAWRPAGSYGLRREGGEYPDSLRVYRQVVPADSPHQGVTFDEIVGRDLPHLR